MPGTRKLGRDTAHRLAMLRGLVTFFFENGKIETTAKSHVNSREDLAIAYTPGVAEPCKVIAKDPDAAYKYTIKANTIAVVSDGSAVLGLGNIGAKAAMPVQFFSKNSAASMRFRSA